MLYDTLIEQSFIITGGFPPGNVPSFYIFSYFLWWTESDNKAKLNISVLSRPLDFILCDTGASSPPVWARILRDFSGELHRSAKVSQCHFSRELGCVYKHNQGTWHLVCNTRTAPTTLTPALRDKIWSQTPQVQRKDNPLELRLNLWDYFPLRTNA